MEKTLISQDKKIKTLLRSYGYLWLLYILFGLTLGILSIWFPDIINREYEQTAILDMAKNNPVKLFVLACAFAPIVEEMMFRTLIKPSHSDLILFICAWPVFLGAGYLPESIHWLLRLAFSGIVLFTAHYILKQLITEEKTTYIRSKLSKYVLPVFIATAITFGLVHIRNYVDGLTFNLALVILVIPQIIAGVMLGWVKLKTREIGWPMLLHFMNNIVPVSIIIMSNSL